MPLVMLRCCAPRRHVASTNCNVFACATNVTPITQPNLLYFIIAVYCWTMSEILFKQSKPPTTRPPTQECRENYPLSHPMNCITLYGGYYASYDVGVLRT